MSQQTGNASNDPLNAFPGGRRILAARWTITARLELASAAQIGTQEGDGVDQTWERDEEGRLVLPGATLAGALRSHLRDRREGYRQHKDENSVVRALFGTLEGDAPHESRLIVWDSVAEESPASALRDGVRIAAESRLAVDRLKYDREVTLPGVLLPIRVDLLILKEGDHSVTEPALLAGIADALAGLVENVDGEDNPAAIALGARKSRGLGRVRATDFRARRYDLSEAGGWRDYAASGYGADALANDPLAPAARDGLDTPHAAIERALSREAETLREEFRQTADLAGDARRRVSLEFDLEIAGTLLIRTAGREAASADMAHLSQGTQQNPRAAGALVSGTAFAGALRAQAGRIARTLAGRGNEDRDLLADLFGDAPPASNAERPKGSRVRVSEGAVAEFGVMRQSRVKIDRFTGGAFETALFDQEPCVGGRLRVRVEVRKREEDEGSQADLALLLLAGRDLLDGLQTLGGESSVGRGVVRGSLTATLPDGGVYRLTTDGKPWKNEPEILPPNSLIEALRRKLAPNGGEKAEGKESLP